MPSIESFSQLIETRQSPNYRYVNPTFMNTNTAFGVATLRLQGGYITRCALSGPDGSRVEILYSDSDTSVAKLNASHSMVPVGPTSGLGGQHGYARWADYKASFDNFIPGLLAADSISPYHTPAIYRAIELSKGRATISTAIDNYRSKEALQTSIGEHLYFVLRGENAEGLRIGLSENDASPPPKLQEIMNGKAQFWPDFQGEAFVAFPHGPKLQINTAVFDEGKQKKDPAEVRMGMLLWHRPGTESICLEPTAGYYDDQGNIQNDLLSIAAGKLVYMETTIQLL